MGCCIYIDPRFRKVHEIPFFFSIFLKYLLEKGKYLGSAETGSHPEHLYMTYGIYHRCTIECVYSIT